MRTFLCSILLCLCACAMKAQPPSLTDSIRVYLDEPARFMAKLQVKHSFITGKPIRTFGLKVGLTHQNRVSYGLGMHIMGNGIESPKLLDGTERHVRLFYGSLYFEYSFYHKEKLRVILPVHLGLGASWHKEKPIEGSAFVSDSRPVLMYEPALGMEYQLFKYLAIGTEIGYRLMLINNSDIPRQFTAPTWAVKLKINGSALYNDMIK